MPPSSVSDAPWFVRAFDRLYLHLYPHRDDEEAERHAPEILRLLGLRAGQRVLDVACGAGRYARALGRRGLQVTGVDLSAELLEEARERSADLPGAPDYVRWDIRQLPFFMQFEAAVSLFTSLGYFEQRADDLAIMQGVNRALVAGGRFLIDYLNADAVRRALEPVTEITRGRYRFRLEREIDESTPGGPVVRKTVTAMLRDTGHVERSYEERVRLYTSSELDALLEEAGFAVEGEPYGDFEGNPLHADAPRWIRVARRVR